MAGHRPVAAPPNVAPQSRQWPKGSLASHEIRRTPHCGDEDTTRGRGTRAPLLSTLDRVDCWRIAHRAQYYLILFHGYFTSGVALATSRKRPFHAIKESRSKFFTESAEKGRGKFDSRLLVSRNGERN